jgi:hypothetical protein
LTPLGLGGRGQARAAELGGNISKAWNKIGGGDNWAAHTRDVLDLVYTVCDGVTGFTGPLGQILGIASYIRYIPFPATMAIGNWMKVVSEFLNTLTFILDIVKVVTGALKTVFGIIAVHNTRDPKLRQEYRDSLKSDIGNLIADGFSVGFTVATGGHKNSFTDGWSNAAKGSGLRGAFQATHAAVRSDTLSNIVGIGLHSAVNRAPYFTSALTNIATQEAKNIGTYGTIFNEAVVKPFIAPGLTGLMLPDQKNDQGGTGAGAGAGTTPAPVQQLAVQRSAGAAAAPAALSTAAPAAIGGRGAAIRALQQASRAALMQAGQNTPTPVTDNPLPPAQVTRSPLQMAPLAEEKSVLKGTEEDLLAQKKVAEAGIAENAAWSKGADEHMEGLKGEKAAVEGVAAKTQEDKAEIAEGKAKTAEGKAQSQKGSSKASEAENGPGGAPGDASTDVPWYKKPFVWIIRKLNQAKSAVMDAITKAIMKALENILNFDNLDEQLAASDTALGEQEAVVNAEPAELSAMSGQLGAEESKTMQAKSEAEQRKAQNEEIKAKAEADYQAVKAQREAVEAEEQATKTDKDAYDATYAPTVEEMKDLAAKQQQGEVAPLRLQMDQRRAILEEMLNALANGLSGHRANATGLVQRLRAEASGNVSGAFGDQPEQKGQALGQIDLVQVTVEGSLTTGIGTREAALAELRGRVAAVAAGEPTTAMLQQINDLEGEIISFADAIDATEAQELDAIHTSFSETYTSLVGARAAA